jgi:MOSC domain-containing protein YiiM
MHITSINIGKQETLQIGNRAVATGIYKSPVQGKVSINTDGLTGDFIGNIKHHGGKDQAVYLYSAEDYAWWTQELNQEIAFGLFGENLTISSFDNATLKVGDCFSINNVLLEITFPRIPCSTLSTRVGDADFVKHFIQARRPGIYTRVLKAGEVQVGDEVQILSTSKNFPTILELYDLWHAQKRDTNLLTQAMKAPIAENARNAFQYWLDNSL